MCGASPLKLHRGRQPQWETRRICDRRGRRDAAFRKAGEKFADSDVSLHSCQLAADATVATEAESEMLASVRAGKVERAGIFKNVGIHPRSIQHGIDDRSGRNVHAPDD